MIGIFPLLGGYSITKEVGYSLLSWFLGSIGNAEITWACKLCDVTYLAQLNPTTNTFLSLAEQTLLSPAKAGCAPAHGPKRTKEKGCHTNRLGKQSKASVDDSRLKG